MVDSTDFYFHSYTEWRHAITERCKINLTPDYARTRISALSDPANSHTQEFVEKYGEAYLNQVIQWFKKAEKER